MELHLRAALLVLVIGLLGIPKAASAAPADAGGITLLRAIAEGARRSPTVAEATRVHEASAAFAGDPGPALPSSPAVTILAGARSPNALPTGPEVALTIQQEVSPRGLGAARRRVAEWAARASDSELERARIEGGALAALAWIDLLEAQTLLRLRAAGVQDAAKLLRIAEVRVTSGAATAVERSLTRAEVGNAELAVLDGEGRMTQARIGLAHTIGEPLERALSADGSLERAEDVWGTPSPSVTRHPAIRAAEGRAAQSAAEASAIHAALGPTFFLGATVWREGSGDRAAAALVTIPLPFFDPARYDTARQETLAAAASGHASRLRAELERDLRIALHERQHTREVRGQVETGVVVPLRSALATAMTSYAAGTNDLGVVLLARRSALAAEERLVIASADVWRADIHAAALGGTLLGGR